MAIIASGVRDNHKPQNNCHHRIISIFKHHHSPVRLTKHSYLHRAAFIASKSEQDMMLHWPGGRLPSLGHTAKQFSEFGIHVHMYLMFIY